MLVLMLVPLPLPLRTPLLSAFLPSYRPAIAVLQHYLEDATDNIQQDIVNQEEVDFSHQWRAIESRAFFSMMYVKSPPHPPNHPLSTNIKQTTTRNHRHLYHCHYLSFRARLLALLARCACSW